MKWEQAKRVAKADDTLRAIALGIVALNRAGKLDATGHLAFRDRCQEIGVAVPNRAYWSILLVIVAGAKR